jgi:hypothetical protein
MANRQSKDPNAPADAILEQLRESGEGDKMEGLDLDAIKRAMSAPGAAETIQAIQAMGADSHAGVGEDAPQFTLPYLPGHGGSEGDVVCLSERFASRPVALIFGSYT